MALRQSVYRGCLLGMAVGDAMGFTVDSRSLPQIREDYGPNGLLGYDLVNGYAEVTSYTQMAAFACNGLLFGLTRGQMTGRMAPFVKYVELSAREWAVSQRSWGRPPKTYCWLLRKPELCRRSCMDTRMVETLLRDRTGTIEAPVNNHSGPEGLTSAIGVGLFYDKNRMELQEVVRLGAEAVALTHGSPTAFLSGAALAYIISRLVSEPRIPLKRAFREAAEAVTELFGHQYTQAYDFATLMRHAITYAQAPNVNPMDIMERFGCDNAAKVLAGAVYACLVSGGDFDRAMIVAVNHSGRSAAVGAIVGAILGIRMGEEALPEFYIECLEPADVLRELADDLYTGCPMEKGNKLFDLDWDYKYRHGGQ
ncbi:MAG: ADP-ribosylglycohydrolase family protein [Oscillospiraceae bacterium]|nr:ADP-ribosylglycohydrolase family protein [Oscillospiraceae bacterium]